MVSALSTEYNLEDCIVSRGIWKRLFGSEPPEDFDARLERLEKTIKMLEIEWTDTYDKFRQLHMRVAKRVQRLEQAPETETTQREEGDDVGQPSLSERHRKLQEQILMRRNRSGLLHG